MKRAISRMDLPFKDCLKQRGFPELRILSGKVECPGDLTRVLQRFHALGISEDAFCLTRMIPVNPNDPISFETRVEFMTRLSLSRVRRLIASVRDAHFLEQSLRECWLEENSMERRG